MSLAFCDKIEAPLFLKCGTRTRTRLVAIRKVAATVGMDTCRALIGLHAYTGCDTVSAFAGKGKTRALTLLMNNKETQDTFLKLGQEWDLSPELSISMCPLCPKSINHHDQQAQEGEIESHRLPPCKDSLRQHTLRANYQAGIWKRGSEKDPQVPSPVGRGWKMETEEEGEQLVLHWMEGQPAPEAVLDLLACNCTKNVSLPRCMCLANGLRCTDMCKLTECENQVTCVESSDEDEDDMENDDD
ncbi:unnamed protein product [Leuciscus chuanchicus]